MPWKRRLRFDVSGMSEDALQSLLDAAEMSMSYGFRVIHSLFLAEVLTRRGATPVNVETMRAALQSQKDALHSIWNHNSKKSSRALQSVLVAAVTAAQREGRALASAQDLWMGLMMVNNPFRQWMCSVAIWTIAPGTITGMPRFWQLTTMRKLGRWPAMQAEAEGWGIPVAADTPAISSSIPSSEDPADGHEATKPDEEQVAEKARPTGKAARKAMLRGHLENGAVWDAPRIWEHLSTEFPWMEQANEIAAGAAASIAAGVETRLPPILLVGAPGLGKTRWARRLASLVGTHSIVAPAGGAASGAVVTGSERVWRSSRPSLPARAMTEGGVRDPFVILDEVDKASANTGGGGSIQDALLPLLEADGADTYRDIWHDAPIDASHVNWVLTANSLGNMTDFLLDRLEVVKVRKPTEDELRSVLSGMSEDISPADLEAMMAAWHEGGMRAALRARDRLARARLWSKPSLVVPFPSRTVIPPAAPRTLRLVGPEQ